MPVAGPLVTASASCLRLCNLKAGRLGENGDSKCNHTECPGRKPKAGTSRACPSELPTQALRLPVRLVGGLRSHGPPHRRGPRPLAAVPASAAVPAAFKFKLPAPSRRAGIHGPGPLSRAQAEAESCSGAMRRLAGRLTAARAYGRARAARLVASLSDTVTGGPAQMNRVSLDVDTQVLSFRSQWIRTVREEAATRLPAGGCSALAQCRHTLAKAT
jgi:hypothetical protein